MMVRLGHSDDARYLNNDEVDYDGIYLPSSVDANYLMYIDHKIVCGSLVVIR
jgi:hypothetical protein